jgi:mRNA interferase MazF
MEKTLEKGDIVILQFPFSDLSSSKRRPALVVANPIGDDVILVQITKTRCSALSPP